MSCPRELYGDVFVPDLNEMEITDSHPDASIEEDDFRFPDWSNVIPVDFSKLTSISETPESLVEPVVAEVEPRIVQLDATPKPRVKVYLSTAAAAVVVLSLLSAMFATTSQASKSTIVAANSAAVSAVESRPEARQTAQTPASVAATSGLRFSVSGPDDKLAPFLKVLFAELTPSPGLDPGRSDAVVYLPQGMEKFAAFLLGADKLSAEELEQIAPVENIKLGDGDVKIRVLPVAKLDQSRLNWAFSQFVDSQGIAGA